jgi:hypothetical protein
MTKILLVSLLLGLTGIFLFCYASITHSNEQINNVMQKENNKSYDIDRLIKILKNNNFSTQHKLVTLHHFYNEIGCKFVHTDFETTIKILSLAKKNNINKESLKYVFNGNGSVFVDDAYDILNHMSKAHKMTDEEIKYLFSYSYVKESSVTNQVQPEIYDIFTIYHEEQQANKKLDYTTLKNEYEKKVIIPSQQKTNKKL